MNTSAPLLRVERLNSGYGKIPVLHDLTFSIWPNEIIAILGSNGAGKSTLMRTLSGLLQPTAGTIAFAGHEIGGLDPSQIVGLGLAQAPEGRRMFSGLTVEENLRLGAFARTDKNAASLRRDIDNIFEYFPRLRERRRQLAGTLSGGEQQMCAIGRALMAQPKLLMIDELSLGLAPIIVEALLDTLIRVHESGTTILLVEQDAAVALGFADRAIVLETGKITRVGDSKNMLAEDDIVKNYLGERT
jgi:branched-chain amino acid transport system ATP-binding protein